jgi:hypothetical protein
LAATTLTLVLMFVVVTIFGTVSRAVSASRATLEMTDRLRGAKALLQTDLDGLSVLVAPARDPAANEGYLEIIEGPIGPVLPPSPWPVDASGVGVSGVAVPINVDTGLSDTTVRDYDDILMFTTRSPDVPFVGRYGSQTIESYEA